MGGGGGGLVCERGIEGLGHGAGRESLDGSFKGQLKSSSESLT